MTTLLIPLIGPMQSWGTFSRFDHRETDREPSKSGVLGLACAALGIDRGCWEGGLEPLARLRFGVRHDRPGTLRRDYQTAQNIVSADEKKHDKSAVTFRYYLADAAFLVGLEGDRRALQKLYQALMNPAWPLALGRKSYVPSEPLWINDPEKALVEKPLLESLREHPWIGHLRYHKEQLPNSVQASLDSDDGNGQMRFDQPLAAFSERRFSSRLVKTEFWPFPVVEGDHVVA